MEIDIEELRADLMNESYGAFFAGGFGGAMLDSVDIKHASPEKLIRIAKSRGIDIGKYEID